MRTWAVSLIFACTAAATGGCGIPGPPEPPSLHLARPVDDLEAQRIAGSVVLKWTSPVENTDKSRADATATAVISREDSPGARQIVGRVAIVPGAVGGFTERLPPALLQGPAVPVLYTISVENTQGRSAGASNSAAALAGPSAPALVNLTAEYTAKGVQLHWQSQGDTASPLVYRITRTSLADLTPAGNAHKPSPVRTLEVADAPEQPHLQAALDSSIARELEYRYQVQAVQKPETGATTQNLSILGTPSNSVNVQTKSIFPPAAPTGLVVVTVWDAAGNPGMDLNWEPNIEASLAGYRVIRIMRRGDGSRLEQRIVISGDSLVVAPAFSDRNLHPGSIYQYSVVAVDTAGNVSPESAPVTQTAQTRPD